MQTFPFFLTILVIKLTNNFTYLSSHKEKKKKNTRLKLSNSKLQLKESRILFNSDSTPSSTFKHGHPLSNLEGRLKRLSAPEKGLDKEQGGLVREKRLAPTIFSRPGARWNKRNGAREGEEWKSGTWVEQGVTVGPQTESPVVWPMRAASERARYHLKSLAFFVIVANANCLLGVQSVSKFFRRLRLWYIYIFI